MILLSVIIQDDKNCPTKVKKIRSYYHSFAKNEIEFIIARNQITRTKIKGIYYQKVNIDDVILKEGSNIIRNMLIKNKYDIVYCDFYLCEGDRVITSSQQLKLNGAPGSVVFTRKDSMFKNNILYIKQPLMKISISNCREYISLYLERLYNKINKKIKNAKKYLYLKKYTRALSLYCQATRVFNYTLWWFYHLKQARKLLELYYERAKIEFILKNYEYAAYLVLPLIHITGFCNKKYFGFLKRCYKKMGWDNIVEECDYQYLKIKFLKNNIKYLKEMDRIMRYFVYDSDLLFRMGVAYALTGNYKRALDYFDKLPDTMVEKFNNISVCKYRLKYRKKDIYRDLKHALTIKNDYRDALHNWECLNKDTEVTRITVNKITT
ncbi:MAG: hypothetical protein AB1765_00865 [Candidatus Hydrogenedentota bacterium]